MPTVGVFAAIFNEQGQILCVKQNYKAHTWTTPGGRMEEGESVVEALKREVLEESGYVVEVGELVGVYSVPFKDDMVLMFAAKIVARQAWQPDSEIAAQGWFGKDELPQPMWFRTHTRILDAFDGKRGVVRVFGEDSEHTYI